MSEAKIPVLFISYQFPPIGGPGVQRSVNLCRLLPESGYQPIVLTIDEASIREGDYLKDETLLTMVGDQTIIYRTPARESNRFRNTLMRLKVFRLFWFAFFPLFWEKSAVWPFTVRRKAREIIRKHGIRLVYTTSGPFSTLLLGHSLKKKLGVHWVADLRDPYTDSYAWNFPSKAHWRLARVFERWILEKPDVLVVVTDAMKRLYEARGIRNGKHTEVIYNGY
jgi:hypothetical protein